MFSIIMMNSFFNNLLNKLVREVDPALKGFISIVSFAIALYCFAKCLKVKDKGGLPFKVGQLLMGLVFVGVALVYTLV